jgi:CRISPR-associated protein Cas5h
MESIQILSFRYNGKYGHFRKPYSTVSSLTYQFPPRTAVAGLLGAILGVPKGEVSETFNEDNLRVAIAIEKEIKTVTHVTNFRQSSSGDVDYSIKRPPNNWKPKELKNLPDSNKSTQIPMELLRNPSYVLYVNLEKEMLDLISRIKTERYVYTPCMGLSEFFAGIEYISQGTAKKRENYVEYNISTVISKSDCSLLVDRLESGTHHRIHEVKAPYIGSKDRRFTYKDYLLNLSPNTLPVHMNVSPYQYEDKIITFL